MSAKEMSLTSDGEKKQNSASHEYSPVPAEKIYPDDTSEEYKNDIGCHKYSKALKVLIPIRPPRKDKSKLPSNKAGLFSYFSLTWLTILMCKAYKQGLQPHDLWDLQNEDCAAVSCSRLTRLWKEERANSTKNGPQLWRAIWRSARTRILISIFISFFYNIFQFAGPSIFLKLTLDYINQPLTDHIYGVSIVITIFVINILRGASFNLMFVVGTHTATRVVGGVQALIFRKILRLKTGGEKLSAQLTSIFTNDMERLFEACISSVFLTVSAILIILSAVYSVLVIGPWALLGIVIYLLFYPVMGLIAKAQSHIRIKTVKKTDQRVALMSEILNSFRLIKMYSWEDSFAQKISEIRLGELKRHRIGALLQAVSSTMVPSISILASICTFLGYTLSGQSLTSSEAFTIYSVFNAMQFSIGVLPYTVRSIAEAKISLARIQKFLSLPEHSKRRGGLVYNNLSLAMKNATFAWEIHSIDIKSPVPAKNENGHLQQLAQEEKKSFLESVAEEITETLFGISLSVERGKLVGICGSIGAGKSSLLSAICGDMKLNCGQMQVNGRLALVSQQAWIYNATFRENILMGLPFDNQRYHRVIRVCCLQTDLDMFPTGDLTEIGEKGVNLSGGQKQRVSLARAVYSDRDIYLLDDPLSAVDANVANSLFENCIKGILATKTVLLVSHGVHFLKKCDEIILLKNGRIFERGTHSKLVDRKGEYFDLISFDSTNKGPSSVKQPMEAREKADRVDSDQSGGKLIKDETKEMGSISPKVYRKFIRVCGGWFVCTMICLALILFTMSRIFNIVWLQHWLDSGDGLESIRRDNISSLNVTYADDKLKGDITKHEDLWLFQLVFALSFVALITTGVMKGVGTTFSVLTGASKLHLDMFNSILRSPMKFVETTPTGRILNRFSRDMDEVDVRIPFFMEFVFQGMFIVISQIVMVSVIFPVFIIPLTIIVVLFIWLDVFLNAGVRELKRLDNNLKSPVIQLMTATMSGLSLIRSLDRETFFTERFDCLLDKHSVALMVFRLSNRWFTYRMEILATIITLAITIICIFTKGQVSTAVAGLSLSTIMGVCSFIPFLMRMKSEFQSRMTSVERVMEYAYELESEAPREIEATAPPSYWPAIGAIEIKDIKLRYRSELPLVLHGISASIKGGEKVGIVGRTGAGKSSMISTMLRLVELDSGSIIIDDIDISTIGLHSLRSAISVIPQDPVLFKGSVRYNIDPFDMHSDESVWTAFERAHLKNMIQKLPLKLEAQVEAAGENFSVGEKQLICLARALLRNSKILLLDEATASVDVETDHLIQQTLKEAFASCTLLTVAHRLNTVASYDRIMVLDAGKVIEFDSPSVLMTSGSSHFKQMMSAAGIQSLDQLKS